MIKGRLNLWIIASIAILIAYRGASEASIQQVLLPVMSYTESTGPLYGLNYVHGLPQQNATLVLTAKTGTRSGGGDINFELINLPLTPTWNMGLYVQDSTVGEFYFGKGNNTSYASKEEILVNRNRIYLTLSRKFKDNWVTHLNVLYDRRAEINVGERGPRFQDQNRTQFRLGVGKETRNHALNPDAGTFYEGAMRVNPRDFNDLHEKTAVLLDLDWRQFRRIQKGVFALRGATLYNLDKDPSYLNSGVLGGSMIMRGSGENRYIGRGYQVFQMEYRYPLTRKIECAPYAELGGVMISEEIMPSVWHGAYGLGVNYYLGDTGTSMRLEIARADAEGQYIITFNHAF